MWSRPWNWSVMLGYWFLSFLQLGYWFFSQLSLGYWCSKPIWRWWKRCTRAIFSWDFFPKCTKSSWRSIIDICGHIWSFQPAVKPRPSAFLFKTPPIFLRRRRLSLMSPDRGRWSILKTLPAFILVFLRLSHEMYAFKAMNSILTPLSFPNCPGFFKPPNHHPPFLAHLELFPREPYIHQLQLFKT